MAWASAPQTTSNLSWLLDSFRFDFFLFFFFLEATCDLKELIVIIFLFILSTCAHSCLCFELLFFRSYELWLFLDWFFLDDDRLRLFLWRRLWFLLDRFGFCWLSRLLLLFLVLLFWHLKINCNFTTAKSGHSSKKVQGLRLSKILRISHTTSP